MTAGGERNDRIDSNCDILTGKKSQTRRGDGKSKCILRHRDLKSSRFSSFHLAAKQIFWRRQHVVVGSVRRCKSKANDTKSMQRRMGKQMHQGRRKKRNTGAEGMEERPY